MVSRPHAAGTDRKRVARHFHDPEGYERTQARKIERVKEDVAKLERR
jgi:hypothetical protein